jgi:hypothetical protein
MPPGARLPDRLAPDELLEAPGCEVRHLREALNDRLYLVQAPSPAEALFHQYWFDGWRAEIDGREAPLRRADPLGICGLEVPEGRHEVRIHFASTAWRLVTRGVSVAALALLFGLAAFRPVRGIISSLGRWSASGWPDLPR